MLSFFVPKPSQKGFTILEVMIAMAIFAIGILGVAKMQIKSTTGNTTARTITEATTVAVDRVERLISL
ncbi:MAG: prepilin-type N-terminal cleavage/methylation domain-containing protein, partial [Desulfobacteraceae bacterium]|nr:prepilin-type N-terminal cleavage/methylation domain-containing protein [Desulfobacteraceae bacterium]